MSRILQLVAFGVLFAGINGSVTRADEKAGKAPKADVVVKNDAKTATAKAGQTVEVQVQYGVLPQTPEKIEVKVNGKKVDSKVLQRNVTVDGRPVTGSAIKGVQFKAEGDGKQAVVIEYKLGDETKKKEVELTVTK